MISKTVAGVVLAAGASSRFDSDRPKQLADWFGETLVHRATRVACTQVDPGLDPVLVVVGHRADEVRAAVDDLVTSHGVRVVPNPSWRDGQSTSVRAAVEAVSSLGARAISGAMFLPCDQPGIDERVLGLLLEAWSHRSDSTRALVPTYLRPEGKRGRGAPAILGSALFPSLRSLTGDEGGRQILGSLADGPGETLAIVDLPDSASGDDVDTVDDLRRLKTFFAANSS